MCVIMKYYISKGELLMYTTTNKLNEFNIVPFCGLYHAFSKEIKRKMRLETTSTSINDTIAEILYLLKKIEKSNVEVILLCNENEVIGFQLINLYLNSKEATVEAIYIKPEYRKLISSNDKCTFAVKCLWDDANKLLDYYEILTVNLVSHRLMPQNVILYLKEGFLPWGMTDDGYVYMTKIRNKELPKGITRCLAEQIMHDNIIPLIDINDPKCNSDTKRLAI